ncbi:MAG: PorV/PorQ family protein [Calditrichia bacterium]
MKKSFLVFIFILCCVRMGFPADELSKVGTNMAQFLKLGIGSRATALGDAYAAMANDVSAMAWNPAGIQQIRRGSFGLSRTQLFADITLNFAGFSYPVDNSTAVGVSVINLSSGDIEVTTLDAQQGTGEYYSTSDLAVGVSLARQLTDRFILGATVKYIEERIYREKGSTFAFDIGSQFDTGIYGMRLGMSLQNFGGKIKLDGPDLDQPYSNPQTGTVQPAGLRLKTERWSIPLVYRMGVMMDLLGPGSRIMTNPLNRFTVVAEANDPSDHYLRYNMGAEYEWNGMFALRGGYRLNYDEADFTLGAGFKVNLGGTLLQIDYSFNNYGVLEYVHQYSLMFSF